MMGMRMEFSTVSRIQSLHAKDIPETFYMITKFSGAGFAALGKVFGNI